VRGNKIISNGRRRRLK